MAGIFKNLDKSDIRLTPFRAYKRFSGTAAYTTYSALLSTTSEQIGNDALITSSNTNLFTTNGLSKNSVWHSIDSLFYRHYYSNAKASFGQLDQVRQPRLLHKGALVISLPQSKYGEGVEPLSLTLTVNGTTYVDDIYGNLIQVPAADSGITASNIVFNTKTPMYTRHIGETLTGTYTYGADLYPSTVEFNNVLVVDGNGSGLDGTHFQFTQAANTTSSIVIKPENPDINSLFNFTNTDFAIGFSFTPGTIAKDQLIFEKYNSYTQPHLDLNGSTYNNTTLTAGNNKFPYRMYYLSGSQKLCFEKGDGLNRLIYTSSNAYNAGTSVMLTRSDTTYYLYYESTEETFEDTLALTDINCANDSNIYIGATETATSGSDMVISSVYFYNQFVEYRTYESIGPLYNGTTGYTLPYQQVGNIFRKHGIICLTHPEYGSYDTGISITNLEYRGTTTIYENEISCTISPGQLARSTNPTMYHYNPYHNQFELNDIATGSGFTPYITRVGLYDDNNNLLVIGSLTQPVQLPSNVDTTFILRYDV